MGELAPPHIMLRIKTVMFVNDITQIQYIYSAHVVKKVKWFIAEAVTPISSSALTVVSKALKTQTQTRRNCSHRMYEKTG